MLFIFVFILINFLISFIVFKSENKKRSIAMFFLGLLVIVLIGINKNFVINEFEYDRNLNNDYLNCSLNEE